MGPPADAKKKPVVQEEPPQKAKIEEAVPLPPKHLPPSQPDDGVNPALPAEPQQPALLPSQTVQIEPQPLITGPPPLDEPYSLSLDPSTGDLKKPTTLAIYVTRKIKEALSIVLDTNTYHLISVTDNFASNRLARMSPVPVIEDLAKELEWDADFTGDDAANTFHPQYKHIWGELLKSRRYGTVAHDTFEKNVTIPSPTQDILHTRQLLE
jgi:hypothetical protein